ncbi:MAG: hypothetical protein ACOYB4_09065, partial [Methyloceanibacter sp.]
MLERRQRAVSREFPHQRDVADAHLDQPGDAVAAKVAVLQVLNAENLAGPGEVRARSRRRVGKDTLVDPRHGLDNRNGLWRQAAPDVVANLLARMF